MILAFLKGLFLGISLIAAIGAQNTFVLRQGILGHHVFYVALFCSFADALLICIGVASISFFLNDLTDQVSGLLFGFCAVWLTIYGIIHLKSVFKSNLALENEASRPKGLISTFSTLAILTFANPHVYLDTMILIGSISQQFAGNDKIAFAIGAFTASFIFFFSLAFGARLLAPIMHNPFSWRILNFFIALIMFTIATNLVIMGNWI